VKLFSVDIHRSKFEDTELLKELANRAGSLPVEFSDIWKTTETTFSPRHEDNANQLHKLEPFSRITEYVEEAAKQFWDELGYFPDLAPKICRSWINLSHKNEGNGIIHNHGKSILSFVIYLDAIEGNGNIAFENPLDLVLASYPLNSGGFKKEVEVRTGDLLIFPSYLKHYTLPNLIDKTRIVIAGDMNTTGQGKFI
jgi:uncharacterized protein (TIGR02466 family)